jgi:competence ComEA-like helix-hairpin-helix protein
MTESSGAVEPPITRRTARRLIAGFVIVVSLSQAAALVRFTLGSSGQEASARRIARWAERVERGGTLIEIDLNLAEVRELSLLPGVGPVLARRIVDNRRRLGGFESIESLRRVRGIGEKKLEQIRPLGFVSPLPD